MKSLVLFCVILAHVGLEITALSCLPCNAYPCETPYCCKSGYLTLDTCGCCAACAKAEGDECGGPWRTAGVCGPDLSCLRSCRCEAVNDKSCVFPFNHNGQEYFQCTADGSEDGVPRCATQVDADGNVVEGEWAVCKDFCPGVATPPPPPPPIEEGTEGLNLTLPEINVTQFVCGSTDLFNSVGRCISNEARARLEALETTLVYSFDEGIGSLEDSVNDTITTCPEEENFVRKCKCTASIENGQLGHCEKPYYGWSPESEFGWCWLDFVPENKTAENCYEDAIWSPSHSRYWSHQACWDENSDAVIPSLADEPATETPDNNNTVVYPTEAVSEVPTEAPTDPPSSS